MKSSDARAEIRVFVLGEWIPSQLADVLALQRAEEPNTTVTLTGWATAAQKQKPPRGNFDFALSTSAYDWPDWICEPLWHDTLAVAVARRSHLLAYREVPHQEVLKQTLICAQSTSAEPWHSVAHRLLNGAAVQGNGQTVSTFDMAMILVSAGYGIAVAPATRLAGYVQHGIATRPLADAPAIAIAYLLRPCTSLTEHHERFAQRVRLVC